MERKTMGALIAALRKANGMTQRELAEKLNVSDKTVSRWERDDGVPELALVPVLAEIFGVTCDELLRGERRSPEEREEARPDTSAKSGKQRQRLLAASLSRYRTRSMIAAGLAAVGTIAALMCNFGFLRAYIALGAAAVFSLAAVVCQGAFVNGALLSVADEELAGAETDRFKYTVVRLAERVITLAVVLLAFSLPLLVTGDAYAGLTARTWLPAGLVCAAAALVLCGVVCYLLNGTLRKSGAYPIPEKEEARWLHDRLWQRRCAVGLAAVLALTALTHAVVYNIWTDTYLAPTLAFDRVEDFVAFMEREEYPTSTYYSSGGAYEVAPVPENEGYYFDMDGNEISEEEALTQTLTDGDGKVICTYIARNRTAVHIRYGSGENLLPIRVVTQDALNVGRLRRSLIGTGFLVLYGAEAAAAVVVYAVKRKKRSSKA